MQPLLFESICIDEVNTSLVKEKNIRLVVLRLDKIHPVISGNKWFKLKYYLEEAKTTGKNHIITFGGAFSNHIIATAAAGNLHHLKTTGIIRGERPEALSHTLMQAEEYGMQLFFLSREDYRSKKLPADLKEDNKTYLIPEGGYGINGVRGAAEILNYCKKENYSHIACAVGTSTMMAGLIKATLPQQKIIGIPVLKNIMILEHELSDLLSADEKKKKFQLIDNDHFGGYAKYTQELIDFMNEFFKTTSIPSDFVYTGKLFYGILDMIKNSLFPYGSNILLIHSGGLQGNLSLPKGTLIF
ncbi:MAG TPA: pyridoxal-phosphate dependent enzyme [Chitinophagaceae bacterium]|jgi:1-aminocyclopropane-1-carboxylate deaminase/D-cysteine desulfhydrase-like pyridoxal-dependent ACC family enzyme|nr:pyridoxal-phosphate dependent enzyme [Chitinophagaceae bacterium]